MHSVSVFCLFAFCEVVALGLSLRRYCYWSKRGVGLVVRGGDPWVLVVFGGFCGCRGNFGVTAFGSGRWVPTRWWFTLLTGIFLSPLF